MPWQNLTDDFSSDVLQLTRDSFQMLLALALGGAVGWRQIGKDGLRIYSFISLGAELFIFVPRHAGAPGENMGPMVSGLAIGLAAMGMAVVYRAIVFQEGNWSTAISIVFAGIVGALAGMDKIVLAVLIAAFAWFVLPIFRPPRKNRDPNDSWGVEGES